jgi:hypothetical protein
MDKDIAQSDPAEGSREVIERELKRQEKAEKEEPPRRPSEDEPERRPKPH